MEISLPVLTTEHTERSGCNLLKGPVSWYILLDLLLSKHASLVWVSAYFTNGYGERLVPPSQMQMIDFITLR